MRTPWRSLAVVTLLAVPLSAQSVDSILGRYLKTIGGMDRIQAVQSLRRSGRFVGGGGFEDETEILLSVGHGSGIGSYFRMVLKRARGGP